MGLIMAFQAAIPLRQFGAELFVANLIGLSMLRELGPLMTAIILAGRSGSAFAAELGTMKVREEIDALKTMGLDPVRFLVVSRVVAAVFMTPLLTIFADLLGLIGGSVVMLSLGFPLITYFHQVQYAVTYGSLVGGLVKAFVFGILVAGIGCLRGLQTQTGATAVGESTTRAVVSGIILITITDGIFSWLLLSRSLDGGRKAPSNYQVEKVHRAYNGQVVLDRLNFEVYTGEVFAILGGYGSGKSTLLKHMIGLYKPAAGRIFIDGEDIDGVDGAQRLKILRKFGVMYQSGALFGSMTLLENVALPLEEFTSLPPEAIRLIATMKLQRVGLDGVADRMPSELSGGMQKRGAIARAMALDPRLLFLDELSAGLDPITSAELDQLVLSLARGLKITFVVVTHELPSIFTIADRVIMLDKQEKGIIAIGSPQELRDRGVDPRVKQFFARQAPSGN